MRPLISPCENGSLYFVKVVAIILHIVRMTVDVTPVKKVFFFSIKVSIDFIDER